MSAAASTPITDMITEMLKNCIPNEMIILAVRSMELALSTRQPVDETAEKRRAWDREYRRKLRNKSADPPDVHPKSSDVGVSALSFLEEKKKHSEVVIKKERKSRGQKLPPDWKPKPEHYDEGLKRNLTRADVDNIAGNMITWATANANRSITTKADWDATFMGFIRRETVNGHRSLNPQRRSASADFFAGIASVAADIDGDRPAPRPAEPEVPLGRVNIDL